MVQLFYHPLLNQVILRILLNFVDDDNLRLVHSEWNLCYLDIYGPRLHPWFQTYKTLKTRGKKINCDEFYLKAPTYCKYKGLIIHWSIKDTKATIYFLDCESHHCVQKDFTINSDNYNQPDLVRFPKQFCIDDRNHYLLILKFKNGDYFGLDYTDLENIIVLNLKTSRFETFTLFNYIFSRSTIFEACPSNFSFFNHEKFQGLSDNLIFPLYLTQIKLFDLKDSTCLIVNLFQNEVSKIIRINENCEILCQSTINHDKSILSVHYWNQRLYFVSKKKIFVYDIYDINSAYDAKPTIVHICEIDEYTFNFVPLSSELVMFYQGKTHKITVYGPQISSIDIEIPHEINFDFTRKFLQLSDSLFLCYDFDYQGCTQIEVDLNKRKINYITNFKHYYDFNKL